MSETSYNFTTNKSKKAKHIQGGEKKVMKKSLSILLAIAMVFTMFAGVALADTASDRASLMAADVIKGNLAGDTMDDDNWKRQDVAVILSRLFGMEQEAEAMEKDHHYTDVKNPAFYDGYLTWALNEGLMQGTSEVNFGYDRDITAQEFATVIIRALAGGIEPDDYDTAVAVAIQLGILAEGTQNGDILTRGQTYTPLVNALNIEIEDGVTLGAHLGLVGWVDEVGDLAVSSVAPTNLREVTVEFNQSVGDTDDIGFAIKRGAATYSSTAVWNDAGSTAVLTAVINLPAADYTLEITGLEDEIVVVEFTVLAETVSGIEVVSNAVALENGKVITFKVSNQYGNNMSTAVTHNALGAKSVYNVTQGKTLALANVAGKSELALTDIETQAALGDVLRVTISHQGFTAQANVDVIELNTNDVISLGDVILGEDDTRLSVGLGEVKLDYTMLDQYGVASKLSNNSANAVQINDADGVQFASSNTNVISGFKTNGNGDLILVIAGDGSAIITAIINQSGVIATATVTVEKDAQPEAAVIAVPTQIVAGLDEGLELGVTVTNQFGDVVTSNPGSLVTVASSGVTLTNLSINSGLNKISFDVPSVATTTNATIEVRYNGNKIGEVTFSVEPNAEVLEITSINFPTVFELGATQTVNNNAINALDQYGRSYSGVVTVTSSTYVTEAANVLTAALVGTSQVTITLDGDTDKSLEVDVKVIASGDIESYTLQEIGTIYKSDAAKYHKATVLNGVDESGNEVLLADNSPDAISSSNSSIATSGGSGTEVKGVAVGTATISAWKGGSVVATSTVTVSDATPVAQSVKWTDDEVTNGTNAHTIVEVLDQYGVNIAEDINLVFTGAAGVISSSGATTAGAATDVTVITPNGLSAKADTITVN
jgi:hypothetical protein